MAAVDHIYGSDISVSLLFMSKNMPLREKTHINPKSLNSQLSTLNYFSYLCTQIYGAPAMAVKGNRV